MPFTTATAKSARIYLIAPAIAALGLAAWFQYGGSSETAGARAASATSEHTTSAAKAASSTAKKAHATPQPAPPPQPTETAVNKPAIQLQAPVIETPDVIASMDPEFVREEAERLDRELEQRKAIERLNDESASVEERLELGAMIQRQALLRHRLLELSVESLTQEVAKYEQVHPGRVAQYTKGLGQR